MSRLRVKSHTVMRQRYAKRLTTHSPHYEKKSILFPKKGGGALQNQVNKNYMSVFSDVFIQITLCSVPG